MDRREDKDNNQANNNSSRLHLNLGFASNQNSNQNYSAEAARQYPTTPSTFPQPVFNNQYGQRETWGTQNPSATNGYGNMNYFVNNPYANINPNQANLAPGGVPYRGPQGYDNATNGLVSQFRDQNLSGNAQRPVSPYRVPSSGQRPAQPAGQRNVNALGASSVMYDEEPPERNWRKYAKNIQDRSRVGKGLTSAFFNENVQRARDRNARGEELKAFLNDPAVTQAKKEQKTRQMRKAEAQFLRFLRTKEKPENYITHKIIGKGAFGEVKLVQKKTDGRIFALKSLVKSEMHKREQLAHVRAERDVLAESDSPWVVKLYTTFQDATFLYMLMEFLPGGDLMSALIKYEVFSEDITRFYMAQLVSALEAVHRLNYIHRDIKPDNILLDRHGHIKLTDFGLSTGFQDTHSQSYYEDLMASQQRTRNASRAKRQSVTLDQIQLTVSNRKQVNTWRQSRRKLAFSTVGTPDYIAPEIFSGKGYNESCDWWSVGTIMYECMVGWPPFCAEETNETYRKIVDWPRYLHFPGEAQLSRHSEDFMRGLINDPEKRLGKFGADQIKTHPWFQNVDWVGLRKINAPFKPTLTHAMDTQNFPIDEISQTDTSQAIRDKERAERNARGEAEESAESSLPFIGYTYRRFEGYR